jgi:anti-repressor protein
MNDLITITPNSLTKDGHPVDGVDARDLYDFLDSKQEFANWIKNRIDEYGFVEGEDFLTNLSKTPNGGRPRTDYTLSIDMAKELAMVEKTEKGRMARRYFIACEKKIREAERKLSDQNNAIVRGVLLEKWLTRLRISFETLSMYHNFRTFGLTQREIAGALGMSRDKAKMIEKMLKEFGLEFAGVKYTQRQARLIRRLESILSCAQINPNPERALMEVA